MISMIKHLPEDSYITVNVAPKDGTPKEVVSGLKADIVDSLDAAFAKYSKAKFKHAEIKSQKRIRLLNLLHTY